MKIFVLVQLILIQAVLRVTAVKIDEDDKTKAAALASQMTLEEKIQMLSGNKGTYVGNIPGNERLGIPPIKMNDGPQGFRTSTRTGPEGSTTAWPSALTVAATFDPDLAYRWGQGMAEEFKGKGANVQLAPGMNLARVPRNGRNFEYCGEDPILCAQIASAIVRGIQDKGVIATAKHWVNNEQETNRKTSSSDVDERTRYELYYPPFVACIEAGVLAIMCSYNRINRVGACENPDTINGDLKSTLGFQGWVMSDWLADHASTRTDVMMNAGLDMEMPYGLFYSEKMIKNAIDEGKIVEDTITQAVERVLAAMYAIGMFDDTDDNVGDPHADVTSSEHSTLAREIAAAATTLLVNEKHLLPLDLCSISHMTVIGDNSTIAGKGSGHVEPAYIITPTEGFVLASQSLDCKVKVDYNDGKDIDYAAALAAESDVVVVTVATTSGEGNDRKDLSLGQEQIDLVTAIAAVNPNTIVAVNCPGAVLLPFPTDSLGALLVSWLPGLEWGNAIADVITGVVDASGRLPITMPMTEDDLEMTKQQYPGLGLNTSLDYLNKYTNSIYSEKLLIGHRWYDASNVAPRFEFGFGLSYMQYQYSSLDISVGQTPTQNLSDTFATVSFQVKNIGMSRDGSTNCSIHGTEVPQLYLQFPEHYGEPLRQLKGFKKLSLECNEMQLIKFSLTVRDISVWETGGDDGTTRGWKKAHGVFSVYVGSSSRKLLANDSFVVRK